LRPLGAPALSLAVDWGLMLAKEPLGGAQGLHPGQAWGEAHATLRWQGVRKPSWALAQPTPSGVSFIADGSPQLGDNALDFATVVSKAFALLPRMLGGVPIHAACTTAGRQRLVGRQFPTLDEG